MSRSYRHPIIPECWLAHTSTYYLHHAKAHYSLHRCKNNIVGRQCDKCAPGFYGYPNCRPCDCNEAGTEIDVCDSFTGRCLCKVALPLPLHLSCCL